MNQITQRIYQRTSEIKSAYQANKVSSERLKSTIVKSLDSSAQNTKDLEQARKNKQITGPHYQSASFLNNINKVLNESIASADSSTLDKINQNLTDIKKLISDYTKHTIDKQDTSISYTDPTRKASEARQDTKISKEGKDREEKEGGLWDFLKGLLKGLIALLGIPLLIKAGKFLFKLGAALYNLGKGTIKAITGAIEFAKKWGPKVLEIVTKPIQWFKTAIWPSVWNLITSNLKKIPGIGKFFDSPGDKIAKSAKEANNIAKAGRTGSLVAEFIDKVKSGVNTLKGKIADSILKKFPFLQDALTAFKNTATKALDKVKLVFSKINAVVQLARQATPNLSKFGRFAGAIAKAIGKVVAKGLARVAAFVASVAAGPAGWIISAILIGWLVYDYAWYIWKHKDKYNMYDPELHLCAAVYGLIGLDLIDDKNDLEAWNAIEPLTPQEAAKLTNSLDKETIRKASTTQRENMRTQIEAEYLGYSDKFNKLYTHDIKYQRNGELLSDEDSAAIQKLELERSNLLSEKARLQAEYLDRLDNKNFYNGEVEISKDPEKFKELVNYFYDELKGGKFWRDILSKNDNPGVNYQKHYLEFKRLMDKGDIVGAAKEAAKMEIFKAIQNMKEQGLDFKTIENAILNSDRFQNIDEKMQAINVRLNENNGSLSAYGDYSEASATQKPLSSMLATGLGTSRAVSAAEFAWRSAHNKSQGLCATYVNNAIRAAGYKGYGYGHGFQVGGLLQGVGWQPVRPPYKVGDVAVFDKSPDTNASYGHAAILAREGWVSDFRQSQMSPYTGDPNRLQRSYQHAVVYRDTGKSPIQGQPNLSSAHLQRQYSGIQNSVSAAPTIIASNNTSSENLTSTVDLTEYWELIP